VKALEEIWFENGISSNAPGDEEEQPRNMPTVLVILGVVSQKDRQANVSDFLHRVRSLASVLYPRLTALSTDSDREV
jgi:hypothetical protein